jgi:uncharacterized protein YukE
MSDTKMHANSAELTDLQSKLTSLAAILKQCYEDLTAGRKAMNQDWQDSKFDEFYEQFQSSEEKILEISNRYKFWAAGPLQLEIDDVKEYEKFTFS